MQFNSIGIIKTSTNQQKTVSCFFFVLPIYFMPCKCNTLSSLYACYIRISYFPCKRTSPFLYVNLYGARPLFPSVNVSSTNFLFIIYLGTLTSPMILYLITIGSLVVLLALIFLLFIWQSSGNEQIIILTYCINCNTTQHTAKPFSCYFHSSMYSTVLIQMVNGKLRS